MEIHNLKQNFVFCPSLRRADDDRVEERWHLELLPPPSFPCEGETAPPKLLSLRSAAVGSTERRRIVADLLKREEIIILG